MKISFPDEQFTAKWRQTLLEDLKRRIQEVGGVPRLSLHAGGPGSEWIDCLLLC